MSDLALPMIPELRRTSQALTGTRLVWWLLGLLVSAVIVTTMAPGHRPGYLGWIGLFLVMVLGALGVASLAAARQPRLPLAERRGQLVLALVITLIVLLISAFFGLGATIWCSLGLTLAYVGVLSEPFDGKRWLVGIGLATLIPLWTWSAIGAWDARLLAFIPVGLLAHNAAAHLFTPAAVAGSPPARPHVLGGLLSLLVAAALLLIVGVVSRASAGPLVLGAIVALAAAGVTFAIERRQFDQTTDAFATIQIAAFVILALAFLASL